MSTQPSSFTVGPVYWLTTAGAGRVRRQASALLGPFQRGEDLGGLLVDDLRELFVEPNVSV